MRKQYPRNHPQFWRDLVRGSCFARNACKDKIYNAVAFQCWTAYLEHGKSAAWQAWEEFFGREYQLPNARQKTLGF